MTLFMQTEDPSERYYFAFSFFKVDPKWRWMADLAKQESAKEVENILGNSNCMYRSYSTLGIRDDADFMLWFAAKTVEEIQDAVSRLYLTVFGKYIIPSRTYFSVTRPSMYAKTGKVPDIVAAKIFSISTGLSYSPLEIWPAWVFQASICLSLAQTLHSKREMRQVSQQSLHQHQLHVKPLL